MGSRTDRSPGKKVDELMGKLIDKYFMTHLSMTQSEAYMLHQKYYREYGLAIEGMVRHHKVDPLEYNRLVDDALPLDDIIEPDPELRQLLLDMDKSKVKLWLFTNAHITHGKRVVTLLGVEDIFEGITYCDYTQQTLLCKPHKEMFDKAEAEAGVTSAQDCYFVDDSFINCKAAQSRGWKTIHKIEAEDAEPQHRASTYLIRNLQELRILFPQFFVLSKEVLRPHV